MCSPSPPPAPDYAAAAKETAAGNLEATRAATKANRINQFTPYGTLKYTQEKTGDYDYAAYNKAMDDYNAAVVSYNNQQNAGKNQFGYNHLGNVSSSVAPGAAPSLENFMRYDPDAGWSQTVELTPEAQAALDQQLALNRKYGEVANIGFDKTRQLFESPELDMSMLPDRAIDVGQTAQQAILSRLNPQLAAQEEALRTRLANQGITLGSDAYGREMAAQSQRANDLQLQAALQGITLDQANRSAALQEQAYLQDRPLNLINALRSGNQVQSPQFQQFAQQATTSGPDMLGAAKAQYQADMDAYNAEAAASGGMLSGLFGVGMGLAGLPVAGGGSLGGNFIGGLFK